MYRLIEFIRSIYITLLFLTLESVAIYAYISTDSYAQAKLLTYSAGIVGTIDGVTSTTKEYFSLRSQNRELVERIAQLEVRLANEKIQQQDSMFSALGYVNDNTTYTVAHVISNRIYNQNNYLVINRGLQHGIRAGMAAVTLNREIVGSVIECSDRHSVIMPIIHIDFRTSGMIEGDFNPASLRWDGEDSHYVTLSELSRYSNIEIGSKVITTGYSQIFPEGIVVGTVTSFEIDQVQSSITATVKLATNMRSVRDLFIIHDRTIDEANSVINSFLEGNK